MKRGWQIKTLGEVCDILDSQRLPITKKDRIAGPYPYYGASGIIDKVASYLFDERLLLLGEDGAKWGAGENSAFIINGKTWVNNHVHILRVSANILDVWLMHYLNWSNLLPYISGVTVPKLTQKRMLEISVPVPPLPEQKRIVGILDAAFEKIDAVQRNAERNLANAKELFQRVLDEEMTPKEGWSRAKIKDFSEVKIGPFGSLLHKSDYVENGVPIVNPCHMRNNVLDEHISQKITVSKAKELSGYTLLENDIVFARRGDIGRCALISSHETGYLCGTGSLFVRIKNRILPSFLFLLAQNRSFISALARTSTGTTMSSINVDSIAEMEISFPSIDMQNSILKKLSAICKSCQEIDFKSVKLKVFFPELKQQILAKAFNGEL